MNWFRNMITRRSQARPISRPLQKFRPRLEALEDRCVPTTWFVTNTGDDVNVVGTLRYDIAHSQNGDTIFLPARIDRDHGTAQPEYITLTHGELFVDHDLTIETEGPAATIDGNNSSRVFEVGPRAHLILRDLSIIDGNANAQNPQGKPGMDGKGGGILNEGSLIIDHCDIENNGYNGFGGNNQGVKYGGGIYNLYGTVSITDSTVDDNFSSGAGGGIYNDHGVLVMTKTFMAGNRTVGGGGAICNALGIVSVGVNSTLFDNDARNGGAIWSDGGSVTVSSTMVEQNTASIDGGGLMVTEGKLTVNFGSTLKDNHAGVRGGGIYNELGQLWVDDTTFDHNSAKDGGGIASRGGDAEITNSHLYKNIASHDGGGIFDQLGKVNVSNTDLKFNTAVDGGGMYNLQGKLKVTDSTLTANTATQHGGGIANNHGDVGIIGSQLITNSAAQGGGLYNDSQSWTIIIQSSLFQLNVPGNIVGGYIDQGGNMFI
jgi:predicted outer membrane repeat protein